MQAWNKGLTKEIDPRIAKYARTLSRVLSGISYEQKYGKRAEVMRFKVGSGVRGKSYREIYGKEKAEQLRSLRVEQGQKKCNYPSAQVISQLQRKKFSSPDYKKKQLNAMISGWHKSPNKEEIQFYNLLKSLKLRFRINTDARIQKKLKIDFGGAIPDFIDVENKLLIEYFGGHWHAGENPKHRIHYFKKYGYRCMVVWSNEMKKKDRVKNRINHFIKKGVKL